MKTIRLWKLGHINHENLSNSIIPTKDMIEKLRQILTEEVKGGVLDIVWGPDIELEIFQYPDEEDVIDIVKSAEEQ